MAKKVHLKTGDVRVHIGITGKKVSMRITLPDNVRRRLYKQLAKFEKD